MNKNEFLLEIQNRLEGLPEDEIGKSLDFYREMIDDRIEDGMSEEEAVSAIGSVDEVVKETLESIPLSKMIKAKTKKEGGWRAWEIVLLILGSPIWVPLMLCFLILIFVFYLVIWIIVIVFFVVDLALFVAGLASFIAGFAALFKIGAFYPLLAIGAGLILIGSSVMLVIPLVKLAKVTAKLGKKIVLWIKSWFIRRKKDA